MYFVLSNLLAGIPIPSLTFLIFPWSTEESLFTCQLKGSANTTSYTQSTYLPQPSLIFITYLNRLHYYVIFYWSVPFAFEAIWPRLKPSNTLFFTPLYFMTVSLRVTYHCLYLSLTNATETVVLMIA